MSRMAKKPIVFPEGVIGTLSGNLMNIKGPKGVLTLPIHYEVKVEETAEGWLVTKLGTSKKAAAISGTTAVLIRNMIEGVTRGFVKQLELNGVGFRMNVQGKKIVFALGFSHPVEMAIPDGLEIKIEGNILSVSGIDKQAVGQFAAVAKKLKPVEPYKGKGFRYVGEQVRRKEGKKAAA